MLFERSMASALARGNLVPAVVAFLEHIWHFTNQAVNASVAYEDAVLKKVPEAKGFRDLLGTVISRVKEIDYHLFVRVSELDQGLTSLQRSLTKRSIATHRIAKPNR